MKIKIVRRRAQHLLLLLSLTSTTMLPMDLGSESGVLDPQAEQKRAAHEAQVQSTVTIPSLFELCKQELRIKGQTKEQAVQVLDLPVETRTDLGPSLLPQRLLPLPSRKIHSLPGSASADIHPSQKPIVFNKAGNKALIINHSNVKLWDIVNGKRIQVLDHPYHTPYCAAFNSAEDHIITGSCLLGSFPILGLGAKNGPLVWDANTGHLIKDLDYGDVFHAVDFNATDDHIITQSNERRAVHNATTNQVLYEFHRVVTHNKNLFLTADDAPGKASIWDINTGEKLHTISTLHYDRSCLHGSFNPQGTLLATANLHGTADLWDVVTGKHICDLSSRASHDFKTIDFNGDGSLIMATSYGKDPILVWEAATGNLRYILPYPNQKNYVHTATFNKKGDRIIIVNYFDAPIHVYDAHSGRLLYRLEKESEKHCKAALSPDGDHAITMSINSDACVWDLAFPKELISGNLTKEQLMLLHALEDEFVKHKQVRLAWIAEREGISLEEVHQILNSFSTDAKNHIIATYKIKADWPYTYRRSLIASAVVAVGVVAYLGYKLFKR